ncbi:MAG: hypothetical protein GXP49_10140 [Deltaproteobacteria bacterium]|nr:hypothetical protein [Deltaproteobacteria bacterium]
MGKLRPPSCEDIRVNVQIDKAGGPPWIRIFLHRYEGDKKGEFMGHCDINDLPGGDILAGRIGRLVVESSPFLRSWLKEQNS